MHSKLKALHVESDALKVLMLFNFEVVDLIETNNIIIVDEILISLHTQYIFNVFLISSCCLGKVLGIVLLGFLLRLGMSSFDVSESSNRKDGEFSSVDRFPGWLTSVVKEGFRSYASTQGFVSLNIIKMYYFSYERRPPPNSHPFVHVREME